VTRGWLPERAGSPIPVGGGDAAAVLLKETADPTTETAGITRVHYLMANMSHNIHCILNNTTGKAWTPDCI